MFKNGAQQYFSPYLGEDLVDRIFKVSQFSIFSLTALGNEMFRLTSATRGGLFLILVFFYFAYVFGAAFSIETGDESWASVCHSVPSCMYVMLRLTFYDGTGLDYAYALAANGHGYLFFLAMVWTNSLPLNRFVLSRFIYASPLWAS